jgi:hypothetical protein
MSAEPRLRRARAASDLSVGQLTLVELHEEFDRRIRGLQAKRAELVEQIEEIDRQLVGIGLPMNGAPVPPEPNGHGGLDGQTGNRPRRPRNKTPLRVLLAEFLREKAMTTRELADAALDTGYETTSKNFVNNVGVALHTGEKFVKENGHWRLVEIAAEPQTQTE